MASRSARTPGPVGTQSHKIAQKDIDARWTKKHDQTHFGYKNPINLDQEHKVMRGYTVRDAAIHDSQGCDGILETMEADRPVHADSAYRSEARETSLKELGVESRIHERAHRHRPLTDVMKAASKKKSRVRARVEHAFEFSHVSLLGSVFVRSIGSHRAQIHIAMTNLTYNLSRYVLLRKRAQLAAA